VYVGMHVMLIPLRKLQLCVNAVVLGKLQIGLKISDQLHPSWHFNSQNTHSHFRNLQLAFYAWPYEITHWPIIGQPIIGAKQSADRPITD